VNNGSQDKRIERHIKRLNKKSEESENIIINLTIQLEEVRKIEESLKK